MTFSQHLEHLNSVLKKGESPAELVRELQAYSEQLSDADHGAFTTVLIMELGARVALSSDQVRNPHP